MNGPIFGVDMAGPGGDKTVVTMYCPICKKIDYVELPEGAEVVGITGHNCECYKVNPSEKP